jgi:hypothetical protein|tara:strand:+ start:14262 stop:14456 length:195 start_codon:yes stop_codon:yes gene_type:complete
MINNIGIIENSLMIYAYAWYAYLFKKKIVIFGENLPRLNSFLGKNIYIKEDNIGTQYGKFFQIQ